MVQNHDIIFNNVFVPDNMRLEKAKDFATGTNAVLQSSRLKVGWIGAGIACGAYEAALAYTQKRVAFKKPVASFQLVQQNLMVALAKCQAMVTMLVRVTQLEDQGKATLG